jgi:CRISPR-associated protein Csx17
MIVECIIERAHNDAIAPSLFGTTRPSSGSNQTPGQFDPLAAGGANAGSGFGGRTAMNPWDFLLCLEGTLLFAAAVTKRLEADSGGALSFPFTVRAVGAGAGSIAQADEPNARAETWFPLWDRPATLGELTMVLAEGRVQVSGRTARDALDFARAVASLGMQRGITSFQRYGYFQRFGRSVIAVPIDRVEVRRNPRGDLVDDLDADGWLDRFRRLRRDPAPARLRSVIGRLENALFDLARDDDASRVQAVLIELGHAQAYMARSPGAREMVAPVPRLPKRWAEAADDGSAAFRIAAALAGLHGTRTRGDGKLLTVLPMAVHFAPVEIVGPAERTRWLEDAAPDVTWGAGNLTDNLARLAERRLLPTSLVGLDDSPWAAWTTAPLDAVAAFLDGAVDHYRISDLLQGLVLGRIPTGLPHVGIAAAPLPPAFGVLKPLFTTHGQLARAGLAGEGGGDRAGGADSPAARTAASVVRLLDAGRVAEAVRIGVRPMRAAGMPAMSTFDDASHPDGRVLLAALLIPLSNDDLRKAVRRVTRRKRNGQSENSTVS